jgi:hypothetical protein
MKALRERRGIALDLGTRRGWGVSVTPRPQLTPGKDPAPIVQEVGWASGPVRTDAENLAPTGIRSSDRPAHRQSLYRQSYTGHRRPVYVCNNIPLNFFWNEKCYRQKLQRQSKHSSCLIHFSPKFVRFMR